MSERTLRAMFHPSDPAFDAWYAENAKRNQWNPDPDDPGHNYDYREFFRAILEGKQDDPLLAKHIADQHYPSEYKTEGHPRTYLPDSSNRLFDTRTGRYLDGSEVPQMQLIGSEKADDTHWSEQDAAMMQQLGHLMGMGKRK